MALRISSTRVSSSGLPVASSRLPSVSNPSRIDPSSVPYSSSSMLNNGRITVSASSGVTNFRVKVFRRLPESTPSPSIRRNTERMSRRRPAVSVTWINCDLGKGTIFPWGPISPSISFWASSGVSLSRSNRTETTSDSPLSSSSSSGILGTKGSGISPSSRLIRNNIRPLRSSV